MLLDNRAARYCEGSSSQLRYYPKKQSSTRDVSLDNPTHKDDDNMLSYAATELDVMSGLSFMVTWNVCMSTFTRGQSIRQATLRQLKIDRVHGPFCRDDVKQTRRHMPCS